MTAEGIVGIVAGAITLLAAVFGGIGWRQIRKHGQKDAELTLAEEERDAAIQDAEQAARPPLDGPQSVDALRRLRDD